MKKIILALGLVVSYFASYAQKDAPVIPYAVPIDSISRLITYEKVVEVKGATAIELYHRINDWFHSYYKNPTEVIREDDSVNCSMMGKPRFRLINPPSKEGTRLEGGNVQYTITVAAKEGRFRYELTAFNWKQLSYYPCEKWLDTKATSYAPVYNDYLQQIDKYSIDLINSLKNTVSRIKAKKDKDNW